MAAITTASPKILSLPQVGSTGILGAGIGFNSQVSTGTIPSTNTDTTAILGIADLQLSAFGSANAGGANGVGSRWTPKHLTITVTNTSGQTLTGIALSASNVDAPDAPGTADYTYGQASEFPSGGLASGDSVTVTYTILGVIKRYLWLTGTWATAPVTGALALDVDLSGEGSAAESLKGSLVPQTGWNKTLGTYSVTFAASAAANTVETVSVPIPSPVQKDALYLVSLMNPTGTPQGLTATVGTSGSVGSNLAASTTYYYAVSAVGPWGETLISATVSAVEGATAYPIALSWTAQGGATSYNVYKGTTTSVNLLASAGNSTSYTDSGNTATSSTAPPTTSTQGPGTSVTVTFQDAQTFGTSTTYYAEVTSIDVADGVTQAYLVQGWLMGDNASQIQVSLDNAASDQAGDVWFAVTQV